MPWSRRLECPDCLHVWKVVLMRRTDRNPPCPECAATPVEALAAPAIGRGAAPATSIKVPDNRTKAIDLAMKIASEDNGGANFRDKSRPGEAVAIPVPANMEGKWTGQGPAAGVKLPMDYGSAAAAASSDNFRGRNANLLDAMADRRAPYMKPVYRQPK